ncbi:unnamed protein product [Rotaria sordida]|uniref:ATP-dependent DNA helicase n=1 Tax=Rotaria sordida TaxID=392033 RepID=A0A815Z2F2_9BILA|nr:unnamed protein product [Rotaria sordida]CAF1578434.1 unnamed protein product [Rotaria sordida]
MYVNRPDEMKNVCLADFASMYNISKKKTDNDRIIENSDDEDITENESDTKIAPMKMKNDEGDIDDTNIEYDQDKNEFLIYEIGNTEGDIFVEMGINTRTEKVEHFNVPKIIPDTEYQQMMRNLNNNQRKYTLNVMNLMKNGESQFFHFINGGAGVGKSTLIKAVYQSILRFYNSLPGYYPDSIRAALCAPTGKAAALIDGMTLHSFLSLPVNQCKHKLVQLNSDVSNRIGVKLKDLQLLIIDEISMVGFTMFQQVDARLQQIMRTKKPFGGISVIVLGDFNQLRPVVDSPLWSLFELFELTEIMRQKDDKTFAIALSNIAKGAMTLEDINLLKSRIVSNENLEMVGDAIRIFRSNAEVDAYNTKVLASLNTEGAIANAYDFCIGDGLVSIREKVLNNIKNLKTTETYGLPLKIDLKVGAKYMMTVNIDTEDGLVNGACGKLIMIDYGKLQKTNETVPCRLWIKFNEEKTGRKARANFHNVMRNRNIDPSLTPIEPVTRQINTRSTNFKVERKQFPLVPSEAMTIYKSQGGTYEKVVVNLKKGMTRSELYVSCSRATKSSGLYLIGDFVPPKPPERNDAVSMMFKTMRSERMLKFSLEFPEESQGERFFVMFHNVQSLNKHILDIRSDKTFLCASMISLVETWTKPTDSLEIEGFKVIHRRNCNDTRKPFGQITYLKNDLNLTSFHKPIWIRKHGILTEVHVDEIKQIRTDIPFNLEDLKIYDQSDMMVVDEEFSFGRYEIVDENEQIDIDTTYNLEDLHASDQSDMMEIDEQSSFENYEIIDSNSRKILDQFLLVLDLNNTTDTHQISSQAQVINDVIEKSPFITMQNKDRFVRLELETEYSVQAFDSVYARTRTTADGNCLYSSL